MRIALISPLFESVPPRLYGGTERVVANLCRGFAEMGHDVTLFASGDSTTTAALVPVVDHALRLANVGHEAAAAFHLAQIGLVHSRRHEFDIIHNHNEMYGLPLSMQRDVPVVTTFHGRLDAPATVQALGCYPDAALVSISDDQRRPLPGRQWAGTVYHGLSFEHFHFQPQPGSYLAFLGRISPEKRPDLAIAIAKAAGVPLKIAAKVDPIDGDYYERVIKPQVDGRFIEFVGEISEAEKSAFLGQALAMVFPIEWPEPFGIAPIEAWACGTPVLARPYGSVPELHCDGVTGFIRESVSELAALVPRLAGLDRARCRLYAERHFSLHRMCKDYLNVYRQLTVAREGACKTFQYHQPLGGERSVLHTVRRATAGHQQDRAERQ